MNLLRRREMVLSSGGGEIPIYETTGDISDRYDTGVLLFDTPKSFTIYCEATFNNYNWTGNAINTFKAIFGINGNCGFYAGRSYGQDYRNNSRYASNTGRYTALVMNTTDEAISIPADVKLTSLFSRQNSLSRKRMAVTYDHTTRTVRGYSDTFPPPDPNTWYTLSDDLISDLPILLNFRGADSTVNVFQIYNRCMSGDELQSKFWS